MLKELTVKFILQIKISLILLSKFFSSVFTAENPSMAPNFHIDQNNDVSLSSITIDPAIVFEKLSTLKSGKALGPDGCPARVFKKCSDQLCTPLSFVHQ